MGKAELRLLNMALQQALEAELFGCDINREVRKQIEKPQVYLGTKKPP